MASLSPKAAMPLTLPPPPPTSSKIDQLSPPLATPCEPDTEAFARTKVFERALLRLSACTRTDLPTPQLCEHPLRRIASASPPMRFSWSDLHPALHPFWMSRSENIEDSRVKPEQHRRTALRANRKAQQVESLAALASLLSSTSSVDEPHLVDFAGGTGPLALPLAALLPWCSLTIVDVNARSLELADARARRSGLHNVRSLPSTPKHAWKRHS